MRVRRLAQPAAQEARRDLKLPRLPPRAALVHRTRVIAEKSARR